MPTTYAINNGAEQFAASTYTGTGATQSITNNVNAASFQPDFIWVKSRSNVTNHTLFDSVRGINSTSPGLFSNLTDAEGSSVNCVSAALSNGFTISGSSGSLNLNTYTYVGWQWKANGTAVTNTAGSISSQVSANTTAGFSIVTYTGTGANSTVGHGLGIAPKMIIVKSRSITSQWAVYHQSMGNTNTIYLNLTNAFASQPTFWNSTSPTSSVFSLGTDATVNGNGNNLVAYCFSEIAGYSKFGGYTGNGLADGPFIYCGFRPRFIMIKDYGSPTSNWIIQDTSRNTFNISATTIAPNTSAAETTYSSPNGIDILSNGFKIRVAGAPINVLNNGVLYAAFAENPFKYANAR